MSLSLVNKDATSITRGILAHGVNCRAAMGSGIALAIKNKWPIVYKKYMEMGAGDDLLSTVHLIPITSELYVANCYTQCTFGTDKSVRYADLDAVKTCLKRVIHHASIVDLPVYLPKIASDRGGLSWEDEVYPYICELNIEYPNVDITICLFP